MLPQALVHSQHSNRMLLLQTLEKSNMIVFLIIYLSFLLDNVLLTVVVPIIPDYLFSNNKASLKSLSPLQEKFETLENENGPLGALLASKAFVQLAFTPFIGYLTEIVGCSIPLLLGSCNMLLAALLFAYGNSYGILVLARALHGSSSAAVAVSGMSILAKNVPQNLRAKIMPLAFGGIAMGVLIGYPLGGAAYQLLGKSAPFLLISLLIFLNICIMSLMFVVCSTLFLLVLQIFYLDENRNGEIVDEIKCGQWLSLLNDKQLLITTFTICICTSSMAILEPCVPMWLMAHLNPPPSKWQLGAVFIPDSVGYFIGSHFAGLLPIASWRVAFSALVLAALSCCALPLANSISQLSLPHFGLGLSVGAVDAALVPFLANLVDQKGSNQYGPVYALQQVFVSLAYAFGPLLGGQAVHILGFPWLMRIIGFLNVAVSPLLLELDKDENLVSTSVKSYSTLDNTYTSLDETE